MGNRCSRLAFSHFVALLLPAAVLWLGSAQDAWGAEPEGSAATAAAPKDSEQDVAALVTQLSGTDTTAAVAAADALGDLGAAAKPAVPALAKSLSAESHELRWHAARALGAIGPGAAEAVAALAEALSDSDALVRAQAAHALGQIGADAKSAAPQLAKAISDPEQIVRRSAVRAIAKIQPGRQVMLPLLAKVLEEADPAALMPTLHALAEHREEAVPGLIEALKHPKARYWACLIVAEIGPDAAPTVPALIEVLDVDQAELRVQALLALSAIGPAANSAVPAAIKALQDEEPSVRYAAALALAHLGSTDAVASLRKLGSESDDEFLRMVSTWAIAKLTPDDEAHMRKTVQLLVEGLGSENPQVRQAAARGLFDLKADPELTAPALVALMRNADPETLAEGRAALAALGARAVPRIVRALENEELRTQAVMVLAAMGPEAAAAVPALTEALTSASEPEYRREVQFALASIGPEAVPAVPGLIESLSSETPAVRYSACYALGKIGPSAAAAADALGKAAEQDDAFQQLAASWALVKILPDNAAVQQQALPRLKGALQHESEMVRQQAASALGHLNTVAAEATAALQTAAHDPNPGVRHAVAEALEQLKASN